MTLASFLFPEFHPQGPKQFLIRSREEQPC
jgi:hypothetical protein